jgi:hypothetical protein
MGIKIKSEVDYINATVFGVLNLSSAVESFNKILKECSRINCKKILIDIRNLDHPPTSTERVILGNLIPFLQGEYVLQIATVASPQITRKEKIAEQIAISAGANVQVFSDFHEALEWLEVGEK